MTTVVTKGLCLGRYNKIDRVMEGCCGFGGVAGQTDVEVKEVWLKRRREVLKLVISLADCKLAKIVGEAEEREEGELLRGWGGFKYGRVVLSSPVLSCPVQLG